MLSQNNAHWYFVIINICLILLFVNKKKVEEEEETYTTTTTTITREMWIGDGVEEKETCYYNDSGKQE